MARPQKIPFAFHIKRLNENIQDVRQLTSIPVKGWKKQKILLRSAVVLFTACWEAFIEDLATTSFDFLIKHCSRPSLIPNFVKRVSVKNIKRDNDPLVLWKLAGVGWRRVLRQHGKKNVLVFVNSLNTPSHEKIDEMFAALIGLKRISINWKWKGTSSESVKKKLTYYLRLRGEIAHRVSSDQQITRQVVSNYVDFIYRLTVRSSNTAATYLNKITGRKPWTTVKFKETQ